MKNKCKREINFIMYHFLEKSKPHERIDILITASANIYQTKKSIPIVMKKCFSQGKLMKQFGNSSFLRDPPFNKPPYFWAIFSWSPFCPNFKNKIPPPPNFKGGWRKLYEGSLNKYVMDKLSILTHLPPM